MFQENNLPLKIRPDISLIYGFVSMVEDYVGREGKKLGKSRPEVEWVKTSGHKKRTGAPRERLRLEFGSKLESQNKVVTDILAANFILLIHKSEVYAAFVGMSFNEIVQAET
jgi:hypothetical protein